MNNEKLFPLIKAETLNEKRALDILCAIPVCNKHKLLRVSSKYENGILHWRCHLVMDNIPKELHNNAIDGLQRAHRNILAALNITTELTEKIKIPI